MVLLGIGLCASTAFYPSVLGLLVIPLVLGPLVFVILNGTVYGMLWAVRICQAISKEQAQGTYTLLCMLPPGTLGTHWLLGTGTLHRNQGFIQVHNLLRGILTLILVTLGIMILIVFFGVDPARSSRFDQQVQAQALVSLATVILILIAVYLDHIQSITIGSLIGMLAPGMIQNRFDQTIWAAGVFLFVQALTYLFFVLVGIPVTALAFDLLGITGLYTEFGLGVLRLAILYGIREAEIHFLWLYLMRRLNADADQLAVI